MNTTRGHTTIGLRKTTKSRLDGKRAPGQCYDGFLCQLMDMWEARENMNLPKKDANLLKRRWHHKN